jgi:concanavalin A-like lectin/glucanase superfamily protein
MVGRAFAFDGATQYVSVTPSPAMQLTTGITIEGWVKTVGALAGNAGIAGTWNDNSGAFRTYLFWVLGGQTMEFVLSPDHAGYDRAGDPTPFPADVWVHVAATYDGTTIRVYRDGVEAGSRAMTGKLATNDLPFLIGRTEGGSVGPNFWKGSIDELSLYDHALTAAQVAAIHEAGSAGKCRS